MGVSMGYRSRIVDTSVIFIIPRFRTNGGCRRADGTGHNDFERGRNAKSGAMPACSLQDTIGNCERSKVIVARCDTVAESTALGSGRSFSFVDGIAKPQTSRA